MKQQKKLFRELFSELGLNKKAAVSVKAALIKNQQRNMEFKRANSGMAEAQLEFLFSEPSIVKDGPT